VQVCNTKYVVVKAQEKRQIGQILEIKKSDTVHTARSVILLFLLRTDYKVFLIINLQDCSAYSGRVAVDFR
jgi:hypothetical protein